MTKYEVVFLVLTHLSPQKASKTLKTFLKSRREVVNRFYKVLHNSEQLTIHSWDKTSLNNLNHQQILTDHEKKVF